MAWQLGTLTSIDHQNDGCAASMWDIRCRREQHHPGEHRLILLRLSLCSFYKHSGLLHQHGSVLVGCETTTVDRKCARVIYRLLLPGLGGRYMLHCTAAGLRWGTSSPCWSEAVRIPADVFTANPLQLQSLLVTGFASDI